WAERMLKPRLAIFAEPPAEYLAGAACLLLSIVLLLPVPLGNILPAITISVFAFGILGRDGLFALIGFVMTAVSLVIAGGVIYGLVKAAIYLVVQWFA
ncbi:exopolysaccharide biosynthesis protein, partial [Rhizobium ruizarguesonis]